MQKEQFQIHSINTKNVYVIANILKVNIINQIIIYNGHTKKVDALLQENKQIKNLLLLSHKTRAQMLIQQQI